MKTKIKIGELAKIKNIDPQTLRYYDKIGLLTPNIVDSENGYRYYSINKLMEVDKIRFLKLLGLSLEEIKKISCYNDLDSVLEVFSQQQQILEKKIENLKLVNSELSSIISSVEYANEVSKQEKNSIEIKNLDPLYGTISDFKVEDSWYNFENILQKMMKNSPNYSEVGHNYGISFICNKEFLYSPNEKYIEQAFLPVNKEYINLDGIKKYSIGKSIITYHIGDISKLDDIFLEIRQYIIKNNLKIRGDIILTPLINTFILKDIEKHVFQLKIPIE